MRTVTSIRRVAAFPSVGRQEPRIACASYWPCVRLEALLRPTGTHAINLQDYATATQNILAACKRRARVASPAAQLM